MHYLHGIPMARLCEQIALGLASLVQIFHRLARLFARVPSELTGHHRLAAVKHAVEPGWRTDGKNGYVLLFATDSLSIFHFRKNRSAEVPRILLGSKPLPGIRVLHRYAGYNRVPCAIHYCHAHLLREVRDLEREFPDSAHTPGPAELRRKQSNRVSPKNLLIGSSHVPLPASCSRLGSVLASPHELFR
jgi:hypothetical protein